MISITLPSDFIQPCLGDLHKQVCDVIENKSAFELDGSEVKRVDGAAVQFLIMCEKAAVDGIDYKLSNPSEILSTAFDFLTGTSDVSIQTESINT